MLCLQEAVALALEFDMQQATMLANRPQEDESLQRKLWLAIAWHLIRSASANPDHTPVSGGSASSASAKLWHAFPAGALTLVQETMQARLEVPLQCPLRVATLRTVTFSIQSRLWLCCRPCVTHCTVTILWWLFV